SHAPVARIARLMAAIIAWYRCADDQAMADLRAADHSADEHGLPMIVVGASSVAAALGVDWRHRRIENDLISPAIALIREGCRVESLLQAMPDAATATALVQRFDGKVEDARRARPALLDEGWLLRDLNLGLHARLKIITGDAHGALHILVPAIANCQRRGRGLAALHFALLRAGALHRLGNGSAALRALIQAAEQGASDGLFRPFRAEYAYIQPLLPALAAAGQRAPLGDPDGWRQLSAIVGLDGPGAAGTRAAPPASPATGRPQQAQQPAPQSPADSAGRAVAFGAGGGSAGDDGDADPAPTPAANILTERERDMLRLMDLGLSNQDIGQRMGITVPTVKWHLHNLFSKIGVRNRTTAVRYAREHRLLPD
ncbi:MAG: LuxR C-terminal-related transcriptional regulator, partial [Sphingopyxis sp.]